MIEKGNIVRGEIMFYSWTGQSERFLYVSVGWACRGGCGDVSVQLSCGSLSSGKHSGHLC